MKLLEFSLELFASVGDSNAYAPFVEASVDGAQSFVRALVDTGAAFTIVNRAWLKAELNYDDSQIAEGELVEVALADDSKSTGHLHALTLILGKRGELVLPDVQCIVMDCPDDILLGQHGVLERLMFLQSGPTHRGRLNEP